MEYYKFHYHTTNSWDRIAIVNVRPTTKNGGAAEQLSITFGHAGIETTERYQRFRLAPLDRPVGCVDAAPTVKALGDAAPSKSYLAKRIAVDRQGPYEPRHDVTVRLAENVQKVYPEDGRHVAVFCDNGVRI